MERKSAICVKSDDEIVGVLIYSIKSECLSCMAVHPDHRRKGIASAMIDMMLSHFVKGSRISVTTFREGDSKGVAPRGMYSKFGFIEDELVIEHSYPQQKFILNVR
jgi:ribosomal protein S18 acetylase RimI-like enzyme